MVDVDTNQPISAEQVPAHEFELPEEVLFGDLETPDGLVEGVVTRETISDAFGLLYGTSDPDVIDDVWERLRSEVVAFGERQLDKMDLGFLHPRLAVVAFDRVHGRAGADDVVGKFSGVYSRAITGIFEGRKPEDLRKIQENFTPWRQQWQRELELERVIRDEVAEEWRNRDEVAIDDLSPDQIAELRVIEEARGKIKGDAERKLGMWALYTALQFEGVKSGLEEVGREYGISRERVRQVAKEVNDAIRQARQEMSSVSGE